MIVSKGNIYEVTLEECISAAVISILPIIVNWLNPHDPRYGTKD